MKMEKTSMVFVAFDAQDVIATSGPLGKPLAYVRGATLVSGEKDFNSNPNLDSAVDALDYSDWNTLANELQKMGKKRCFFEITKAQKLDTGYGVSFDTENSLVSKPYDNASIGGTFEDSAALRAWLTTYLNQ